MRKKWPVKQNIVNEIKLLNSNVINLIKIKYFEFLIKLHLLILLINIFYEYFKSFFPNIKVLQRFQKFHNMLNIMIN